VQPPPLLFVPRSLSSPSTPDTLLLHLSITPVSSVDQDERKAARAAVDAAEDKDDRQAKMSALLLAKATIQELKARSQARTAQQQADVVDAQQQ
jgi:hypothetical protein